MRGLVENLGAASGRLFCWGEGIWLVNLWDEIGFLELLALLGSALDWGKWEIGDLRFLIVDFRLWGILVVICGIEAHKT